MIKFTALIHKETGTVIKYDEWFKMYSYDNGMALGKHCYHNEQMIFSDDFEIIYDSEFTLEELGIIFRGNQKFSEQLMIKIKKNINDKELLKFEHRIEV